MRSDNVKTGMQQAPHRSLFNALGLTKEELERPLVGIVCSYNEIVPGHMNLDKIANAVKMGVAMAEAFPACSRQLDPTQQEQWTNVMYVNLKIKYVLPVDPAPECIQPTV